MRRIENREIDGPIVPREHEERMKNAALQAILSSASGIVIVQDPDGRFAHVSDTFVQEVGRPALEIIGRIWSDIELDNEETAEMEAMRKNVLRSGETARAMLRTPRTGRCFSFFIAPLMSEDGKALGTLSMGSDVTEQKELERLREEGSMLRQAVSSVRDLVFVKDLSGRYVMANPAILRLVGKSLEETIGHTDVELFDDKDGALVIMENDQRIMRTGIGEMIEETVTMAEGEHTFLSDKIPSRDRQGRITGVMGITRDITERKEMEDAERARRAWMESLIQSAPVAISVSRDGYSIYANPPYLRMFGYDDFDEIRNHRFVEQIAPEDRDRAIEHVRKHDGKRKAEAEIELMGVRRDGSRFPFRAAIAYAVMPDGPALLGFFTDITESRRLKEGLEETQHSNELFVDILTHDISNYNAAAIGYLQLAETNLEMDDKGRGYISRSLQAMAYSSELIANIRDLQNIEEGRDRAEPIDVCSMLKEITDAYQHSSDRQTSITLTAQGGCMVFASSLLRGAFSNLISNAIKHSSGPVEINVTVSDQHHDGADMVRVDIADDGPGIPDERKGIIFDRSLMGLAKPVSRGLGLYLVKRLVENYGGEVWVEDRIPGDHTEGARFVVLLPTA